VTLENMWNIFDFMNVQSIHNSTFFQRLPDTFLAQARALANFHESGIFTDSQFDGIGNIAARTMLPSILTAIQRISNSSDPLKLHYSAISYKPLISLFNMTGVVATGELPAAIVNYAAAVVLEIRQPSSGAGPVLRFKFKNGTDDDTFQPFDLSFPGWTGTGDVPVSTFVSAFTPAGVFNTTEWCMVCNNTVDRGCDALVGANSARAQPADSYPDVISTLWSVWDQHPQLLLSTLAMLLCVVILSFGKKGKTARKTGSESGPETHSIQKPQA